MQNNLNFVIRPTCAKLLNDTETFAMMSPYCKVVVGNQEKRTRISEGAGKFPTWHEELIFEDDSVDSVVVSVHDGSSPLPQGLLGQGSIPFENLRKSGGWEDWIDIEWNDKKTGTLKISCECTPEVAGNKRREATDPQVNKTPQVRKAKEPIANPGQNYNGGVLPSNNPPEKTNYTNYSQPVNDFVPVQNYSGVHNYPSYPVSQNYPQSAYSMNSPPGPSQNYHNSYASIQDSPLQGYPSLPNFSPQSYPPKSYPPQSYPPQSYPPQSYPPQSYPPQSYPPQPYHPQAYLPPSTYPSSSYVSNQKYPTL